MEKKISSGQKEAVVDYNSEWHQGVIGIAAGRITENYQLPAVLMTSNRESDLITGSARSIEGININDLIAECSDLLEKHGGHAAAAGFSLKKEQLEKFKLRLKRLLSEELNEVENNLTVETDLNLKLSEINRDFYQKLRLFAPFGEANPEPVFYLEADVLSSREISAGRHKKLILEDNDQKITALWWWAGNLKNNYKQQLACRLTENIYRGNRSLQLEVKAINSLNQQKNKSIKSGKTKIKKRIEIIDWRNKKISELKAGASNTVYFAEGLKKYNLYPLINRNYYKKTEKLVLLTLPPSVELLTEIIVLTEARKLILINKNDYLSSFKGFIKKLLSLIKYTINHKNKIFDLNQAVIALNTEDLTLKRALEYLRAVGMINFEYISYHELLISKDRSYQDQGKENLSKKALKRLLGESNAFKRFLQNKRIDEIEKILNKSLRKHFYKT